jgi:hypothetical protein
VSKAECECGDGLQTEEHTFCVYKLYEDQKATMMAILSESSKKECRKSVTELLKLEVKRLVQGACYVVNKITKFILEKWKKYLENINSMFLELRDMFRNHGAAAMIE